MTHMLRVFIALLGLFLLTGCAGFRSGETADLGAWPTAQEHKPSLRYVVQGKIEQNGTTASVAPASVKAWSDIAGKAYKDSALFSQVTEGFGDADILAEVKVTDGGTYNAALAFISGFTFLAIPATANDVIMMETTYRDRQGNELAGIKKQDSVRTWMHILLIPGLFIANPIGKINEVHYDNHKASILAAHERGVF